MTDMTNNAGGLTIDAEFGKAPLKFAVDETYWGYIIRKVDRRITPMMVLQGLAMFFGASFAAASVGLILAPQMMTGGMDLTMRGGAAIFFGAISAYLLWFASRGSQSEIQIDNSLGEVREVVRNRAGKSSLIGRYGFDSIGGVFLDRTMAKNGESVLSLRYRKTAQTLPVALGTEDVLAPLRNRLGQDLMLDTLEGARPDAVRPSRHRAAA